MATASDNFNRSNEGPIAGDWETIGSNGMEINSNAIRSDVVDVTCFSAWKESSDNFSDDHWSELTFTGLSEFDDIGPACRCLTSSGQNAYYISAEGRANNTEFRKIVADSVSNLDSGFASSTTEVWRVTADGTTISCDKDTVEQSSVTDSSLTTGQPGAYGAWYDSHSSIGDDWNASDIGAPPGLVIPVAMHHYTKNIGQ